MGTVVQELRLLLGCMRYEVTSDMDEGIQVWVNVNIQTIPISVQTVLLTKDPKAHLKHRQDYLGTALRH